MKYIQYRLAYTNNTNKIHSDNLFIQNAQEYLSNEHVFNELKMKLPPRDILRWKMELKHQYLFFFTKAWLEYKSVSSSKKSNIFSCFPFPSDTFNSFSVQVVGRHFETPVSGDLLAGKVAAIVVTLATYLWSRCCHRVNSSEL